MNRFKVVICGAGVAGIEGLLRLRRLAGERVEIVLLSPDTHFGYRPLAVMEPFGAVRVRRYPISRIAEDTGATWVQDSLAWVDRGARMVHSSNGSRLPYDALFLAMGGQQRPSSPHMDVFSNGGGQETYRQILDDVDAGRLRNIAFVVPEGPSWPLPLYELALMTAHRAQERGRRIRLSLITPSARPLLAFGISASDSVAHLIAKAGITLYCSATAAMPGAQRLVLGPSRVELHPQRTVTLPRITGPDVRGIPGDGLHRFLEVDTQCRVPGTDGRVFAAGDATNFPIKHGGLSAQQADTAAAGIAHLAGFGPPAAPLHPVIRGVLLTGQEPLHLYANVIAGQGWDTQIGAQPPAIQEEKIDAAELGPYLTGLGAGALTAGDPA